MVENMAENKKSNEQRIQDDQNGQNGQEEKIPNNQNNSYQKHEELYHNLKTELEKIKQEAKQIEGLDVNVIEKIEEKIKQLYDIAIRDEKTGLYNFRFFRSLMAIEIEKAERFGEKLSLAILDIDNFKAVNDKFGHAQGDLILKQIASLLKQNIRRTDVVARFGGEEFVILFSFTDWEKAKVVSERIRQKINSNMYLRNYEVTVSIGVAGFRNEPLYDFFRKADEALAYAKEHGKNMTAVYEEIKDELKQR
jgi:diguanylate cyclase (GGDEF)-like protein